MTPNTYNFILEHLQDDGPLKYHLISTVLFEKTNKDGDRETMTYHFHSTNRAVINQGDIELTLSESKAKMEKSYDEFLKRGSGWSIVRCETLDLKLGKYDPLRGGSYIPTPVGVPRGAFTNVENRDNRCFEWSSLAALYSLARKDHRKRPSSYEAYLGELDFTGIDFPVKATDWDKFELQNPNLVVSIYYWRKGPIPLHVSKRLLQGHYRVIDLLLLKDPKDSENQHYICIKSFSTLMSKYNKYKVKKYTCRNCLHVFSREDLLTTHLPICLGIGGKPQVIEMPEEGIDNILKFTSHHRQMRVPYIIYSDFESLNILIEGCANPPDKSSTRQIAKQVPCSYYYIIIRCDGVVVSYKHYRGENAAGHFLESLRAELVKINEVFKNPAPILMVEADQEAFNAADRFTHCHICDEPLGLDKAHV